MEGSQLTKRIKELAMELGFFDCGIAAASFLEESEKPFDSWLQKGYQSGMGYMQNHREKRLDPTLLVEGAQSVIVFLFNYYPDQSLEAGEGYLISRYAYGEDYHTVLRRKLNQVIEELNLLVPGSFSRAFVDSAPVLERAWATRAGLGWIGKNSMLISRRNGSYYFIAEIITDIKLETDKAFGGDYCDDCSRCIDACPTNAITAPKIIDAGRCISYLTIENKGEIPSSFKGLYDQWVFGCDICQQVCPWNRYATGHTEPAFEMKEELRELSRNGLKSIDKEQFNKYFKLSPMKRAKFEGLKRNIEFLDNETEKE
ncbi:MAG: tRNA epoxyqueuosine(34) reductase QueG [Bacteroidales bacterium]|nr:tRNA epoxyqueuosine(34) reductase QueG [Bacteroidales bacterium]